MSAQILDGREVSRQVRRRVKAEVKAFVEATGVTPCLAVVIVGEDPASQVYVKNKKIACEKCGILSREYALPESTTQDELVALLRELNADAAVHGILVQHPLPAQIEESLINHTIDPIKDVDAFHTENVGSLFVGDAKFLPCTPAGVMELLDAYEIPVAGRECVVVGRSNLVGKPQAMLLLQRNGTVTVCHSRTRDLGEVTRRADILVVAIGKPRFVTADMVKEGAVVIDVGVNRLPEGLCGDVDFEPVAEKASFITPVPGGVGRMTIAMLMQNTLAAARLQVHHE